MAVNINLPNVGEIASLSDEQRSRKIVSYLQQLTEQLRFVLGNLDSENFTKKTAQLIRNAADTETVNELVEKSVIKSETDYKAAIAQLIDTSREITAAYESAINVVNTSIRSDVKASYALKSDVNTAVASISTTVDQQATSITASLTRVADLENAIGGFTEATFTNYIRFDENGIELGRSDSEFKARLTNTKLSFLQGSHEIAYISNNTLYITDAHITGRLTLGGTTEMYDWQIEPNGSMSLVYREG